MRVPSGAGPVLRRALGAVAFAAAASTPALGQNLLTNGGFETGNFMGFITSLGTCSVTGLGLPTGTSDATAFSSVTTVTKNNAHSGTYAAGFGASGCQTSLSQMLSTTAGQQYTISFFGLNPTPGFNSPFRVVFGGNTIFNGMIGNSTYQQFTFTGMATSTSTLFQIYGGNDLGFTRIDDISVMAQGTSTVPEPSSLALLGTGLVGLVPMIRRRK